MRGARTPAAARYDSPAPYGMQIDGLGGGSSSTSKVVLVSRSTRPACNIDYLFGAVAIDAPLTD